MRQPRLLIAKGLEESSAQSLVRHLSQFGVHKASHAARSSALFLKGIQSERSTKGRYRHPPEVHARQSLHAFGAWPRSSSPTFVGSPSLLATAIDPRDCRPGRFDITLLFCCRRSSTPAWEQVGHRTCAAGTGPGVRQAKRWAHELKLIAGHSLR